MTDQRAYWLEGAEYVSLGLTIIASIASVASGIWFLPLFLVTVTQGLNIVNRSRARVQEKRWLSGLARQLQDRWEEERAALTGRKDSSPPVPPPANAIPALEESLNGVIEYLNHHALRERVERLEKAHSQLRREVLSLEDPDREAIAVTEGTIDSRGVLPTLNLTPPSPPDNVPRWEPIRRIEAHQEAITALALTPDDRFLLTVGWDRQLKVWDLAGGDLVTNVEAHDGRILCLAVTDEGEGYSLATGGFDRTVKWWTFLAPEARLRLRQIFLGHEGSVHALGFAPRARLLVSGSFDRTLRRWSLDTGTGEVIVHDPLGGIYALAIPPREDLIAGGGGDGTVTLWRPGSEERPALLTGNVSSVRSLALSPDGRTIAAACADGTVKLWNYPPDGSGVLRPTRVLDAHYGQVTASLFTRDRNWLLSGGTDGQIAVWQSNCSRAISTFAATPTPSRPVSGLAESADGRYLVVADGDGAIGIWERTA